MLQILFFHSNSIICDHKTIFGIDKHVNFSDLFGKIKRLNVHPVFAALYLAHIKHIIDKTQKVVAGSLDLLDILPHFLRIIQFMLHQVRKPHDHIHRSPDVMAHIRQETALGGVGTLRDFQCVLNIFTNFLLMCMICELKDQRSSLPRTT